MTSYNREIVFSHRPGLRDPHLRRCYRGLLVRRPRREHLEQRRSAAEDQPTGHGLEEVRKLGGGGAEETLERKKEKAVGGTH